MEYLGLAVSLVLAAYQAFQERLDFLDLAFLGFQVSLVSQVSLVFLGFQAYLDSQAYQVFLASQGSQVYLDFLVAQVSQVIQVYLDFLVFQVSQDFLVFQVFLVSQASAAQAYLALAVHQASAGFQVLRQQMSLRLQARRRALSCLRPIQRQVAKLSWSMQACQLTAVRMQSQVAWTAGRSNALQHRYTDLQPLRGSAQTLP